MRLHDPTDIAHVFSDATLLDGKVQTFFGNPNQLQSILADPPNRNSCRSIADKTIESHAHVYGKNIAFLQLVTRRKAVHDLFIHRRANRERKTVVAFEGWIRARVADHLVCGNIDLERSDARKNDLTEFLQHLADQPPRSAHLFDLFLRLSNNHYDSRSISSSPSFRSLCKSLPALGFHPQS